MIQEESKEILPRVPVLLQANQLVLRGVSLLRLELYTERSTAMPHHPPSGGAPPQMVKSWWHPSLICSRVVQVVTTVTFTHKKHLNIQMMGGVNPVMNPALSTSWF